MAVRHGYGKIAGTDALVFAYDTGDIRNSYKGRPTTNQFPIVGTVGEGAAADNTALFPTRGTNSMKRLGYGQTFGGYTIKPSDAVYKFDAVTNYVCAYHGGSATIPVGAYVTFTFEYLVSETVTIETGYLANLENYGNGAFSANPGTIGNSIERNVWHKVKFTAGPKTSVSGTQAMFLYPGGCSGTRFSSTPGYILYKNPMVEFKSDTIQSQYTSGTRSATQGLLDLTRNNTIDLSNVSFDSNAQKTFDGTDDYVAITNLLASENIGAGTQLTISLWLNCGQYGVRMPFSTGQTGNDRIYYWTNNSINTWRVGNYTSTTGHSTLPSVGTWFNTTLVIDGTNITGYLNGVEDYTGSYTSFTTADYVTFGKHGTRNEYHFNGKIAVAKIYNRALTAAEVQSNYQHYKNRFGI